MPEPPRAFSHFWPRVGGGNVERTRRPEADRSLGARRPPAAPHPSTGQPRPGLSEGAHFCLGAATGAAAGAAPGSGTAPHKPLAQNVIVLLDDGGGYNQHEAGSLYDTGERAGEIYQGFPFQTAMAT